MALKNLLDIPLPEWEKLMLSWEQPAFRAGQLAKWVFHSPATDFPQMTDLPLALRQKLQKSFRLESLSPRGEVASRDGKARKVLFQLRDGKTIESVLLSYEERLSVCVSTQVGCAIGCPFCATGQQGFERQLSAVEIVDQVLYFTRRLEGDGRVGNVVFMGMGEPLANFANTWRAVEILNSAHGFGLGARRITISTAGLVPQIVQLSQQPLQVRLAVSLQAPDDALRNVLVPINRRYPLKELMAACRSYGDRTGRRVTFEYVLFDGVNDSVRQAVELAHLLRGMGALVNLIPANASGDPRFRAPSQEKTAAFLKELENLGVKATLRARRGADIVAGCGQLRSRAMARAGAGVSPPFAP
ncbi:MAG: 23S rRNA (adenine(2503)-C(2))-methyltransferase RlmN [Chloroflexota bacterium]|nr:23S rRNA (adenine(2503)-C(2))-methyltransferase RlmN [Chloroflexota bacterium]